MMENKNILLPTILFLSFLVSCNNKSKNESLNSSVPGIILEKWILISILRIIFMIMLMEIGLKLHKFQMMRRVGRIWCFKEIY